MRGAQAHKAGSCPKESDDMTFGQSCQNISMNLDKVSTLEKNEKSMFINYLLRKNFLRQEVRRISKEKPD